MEVTLMLDATPALLERIDKLMVALYTGANNTVSKPAPICTTAMPTTVSNVVPQPVNSESEKAPELTLENVRAIYKEKKDGSTDPEFNGKVKAILAELGTTTLPKLEKDKYSTFIEKIKEL